MNNIIEELKTIEISGVRYEVSNIGKVYKDGVLLKQNTNADNYLVIGVKHINRNVGVHRFVAMAFVDNDDPTNKTEVNHIDFNRQNNTYNNLEWLSHADNVKYSHNNGRYKRRYGKENPNYGNKKLSKKYSMNKELALEKQSRKGSQNGKATKITLLKDNKIIKKFDYIGECCEYLHKNYGFSNNTETIRCGIRRSINKGMPYKGFTFQK